MTRRRSLLAALFVLVACRSTPPGGDPIDTLTHAGDGDGDGFPTGVDCDDGDSSIHADAEERCDGIDNDCDGLLDDADDDVVGASTVYVDADGDLYGDPATAFAACDPSAYVTDNTDCDDTSDAIHPDALEVCGDGVDGDCTGDDATCTSCDASCTAFLPVAPSAGHFGWQALQDSFIDANGESCRVPVVLAMGQHATCYVDPDGALRCAGQIFNDVYGPTYTSTGLEDVTQIILVVGDAGCALVGGVPTCLGDYNYSGQLGNGSRGSSETWTPWAAGGEGFWALTTGTSDSYCAINDRAEVWCTGYDYGLTPILVDGGPTSAVWISTFGETYLDDGVTFRASQARTECVVTAAGLECPGVGISVGRPGHVVDGALIGNGDSSAGQLVWLEDDGRVQVYTFVEGGFGVTTPLFDALPVLAIATNYYTDSVCGVYNDGSIVCVGTNDQGKLGAGHTDRLATPEVTQPAGTIDLACR